MQRRHMVGLSLCALGLPGCVPDEHVTTARPENRLLGNSDFSVRLIGSGPAYVNAGTRMVDRGETGVNLVLANNYHLSSLKFSHIAGAAVNLRTARNGYAHVGFLSQIAASHSYFGFRFEHLAEYETVSDCMASRCMTGFLVEAGNNMFSNCKATSCFIGVKITGGDNNGHGVWNGLLSNHCTNNLVCENVSLGEHFSGCCFIGGQWTHQGCIRIIGSQGVSINGGQIGHLDMVIDGKSQILLNGVTFGGKVDIRLENGGVLLARNNMAMPGTDLRLNGLPWSGNH